MAQENVDKVTAVKATLEMMVAENQEIHQYFKDLLGEMKDMEQLDDVNRRRKFEEMKEQGNLDFEGIDFRHFIKSRKAPLRPPVFISRTRRRLKNTNVLINAFLSKGLFEQGHELREEIEAMSYAVFDESNINEVMDFKGKVEALRETPLFQSYLESKDSFVAQDDDLRTDAEFLATKESAEDAVETFSQRGNELESLEDALESGDAIPEEIEAEMEGLSLSDGEDFSAPSASDLLAEEAQKEEEGMGDLSDDGGLDFVGQESSDSLGELGDSLDGELGDALDAGLEMSQVEAPTSDGDPLPGDSDPPPDGSDAESALDADTGSIDDAGDMGSADDSAGVGTADDDPLAALDDFMGEGDSDLGDSSMDDDLDAALGAALSDDE